MARGCRSSKYIKLERSLKGKQAYPGTTKELGGKTNLFSVGVSDLIGRNSDFIFYRGYFETVSSCYQL